MRDDCGCGTRLIYACSGAADVGAIADLTARKLSREGFGGMSCLAAIGANVSGFVESAKSAENIVIDGCPVACARGTLERIGVACTAHVLTDLGLVKGKAQITDAVVGEIADKIKQKTGRALKNSNEACQGNCSCG